MSTTPRGLDALIPTSPPARVQQRTAHTAYCPDTEHVHRWQPTNRRLADLQVSYAVRADGSVVVSEEVLAQLLVLARYEAMPA